MTGRCIRLPSFRFGKRVDVDRAPSLPFLHLAALAHDLNRAAPEQRYPTLREFLDTFPRTPGFPGQEDVEVVLELVAAVAHWFPEWARDEAAKALDDLDVPF